MERGRWGVLLGLAGTLLLLTALPAAAQDWQGAVGVGYAWENVVGSEESYRTQSYDREGFWVDELTLSYTPGGGPEKFRVDGYGWGGAVPDRSGRVFWKPGSDWTLEVSYDRKASYFALSQPDFKNERDDWHVTRWSGRVAWDGWSFARLSLDLDYNHQGGWRDRPLYGLNNFYGWRTDLDRTMRQGTFLLETKDLPVHLYFEQAYAVYERKDRWSPIGHLNMKGGDPDFLAGLSNDSRDKQTVPTTRLGLTYANPRFEVAADVLYSNADLDSSGPTWKVYDLAGGSVGSVSYIDDVMGSASQDTFAGRIRMGFHLAPGWAVRLNGDYRDTDMDSSVLGQRLIRMSNPSGTDHVDIGLPMTEGSTYKVRDGGADVLLEYRGAKWSAWGGFFLADRDVSWTLPDIDPDLDRSAEGFVAGASYRLGRKLRLLGEYRHGDFEQYIFRTDPQSTDRIDFRLQAEIGRGWSATAHARFEEADNPSSVAALDRHNEAFGATFNWAQKAGKAGASVNFERLKITQDTNIFLPGGYPDVSVYGLNMYTFGASGFWKVGPVTLNADFLHLQDRGATWPLVSWTAYGAATWTGPCHSEICAFVRYRDYNEDRAERDDFEVTRYGLIVRWRF